MATRTERAAKGAAERSNGRAAGATGWSDVVTVIRPVTGLPRLHLLELWRYRELAFRIIWRDIKVRYKQTFLGVAWALLVPLFTSVVYVIVFGKFAEFPAGNLPYPLLVLSGTLPMQYFTSSLTSSSTSLVSNVSLVTKVYFPRVLLPLAGVIVPIVEFVIGWTLMLGVMAWYDTWPGGIQLLLAPAFMGLAFVTALGAGFLLSAVNVRYRDVPYALPVILQVLPLLSAVPYALSAIPEKWQWLLSLNPMTSVITGWRWAVLDAPAPEPGQVALSVGVALVLVLGGLAYFRRTEATFADKI
jgi:homopolymeric O-antigen transport system permease protein